MLELITTVLPSNLVLILIVVLVCLFLTREYQKNAGVPPGPYGLPWFGYVFFLDTKRLSKQVDELCRRYKSDIISFTNMGSKLVVLNTYELLKEVFQKRADVADRPGESIFDMIDPGYTGVIAHNGPAWKEARRFSISALRDFGMGRVGAEEMIQDESKVMCDMIKKHNGEAFDPQSVLNIAVANIICGMVFGQRFEHDDEEFMEALNGINRLLNRINDPIFFFFIQFKIGREYIVKQRYQEIVDDYKKFSRFVKERIKEHKREYNGQATDLIYCYLKEMEQGRNPEVFDDKMLESLIVDYFIAGSETTYSTLRWCLLAMGAHPEIQKKVQEELDEVIGEREPTMGNKKQTPYAEAALSEVQRNFTLLPLGLGHTNIGEDIEIQGYKIPKGSFIIANLRKFHHDEKSWKNPHNFDPENFLEDGKVCNLDKLLPFSIGRRACAGESLARMELYLFFTSLMKNFEIRLENVDVAEVTNSKQFGVCQPNPFKIRMKSRN